MLKWVKELDKEKYYNLEKAIHISFEEHHWTHSQEKDYWINLWYSGMEEVSFKVSLDEYNEVYAYVQKEQS